MSDKNIHTNLLATRFTSSLIPYELYNELIKGKQTILLLYTSIFAYLISSSFSVSFDKLLLLAIGMFYAISGSTLFNMYFDRDIDAIMERTKNRALPAGKIQGKVVLWHGFVFSLFGISLLGYIFNILTMLIVFLGVFFDVIIYTLLLKRRTKFSIIFGGIAGGLPAVAGRAAAINNVDLISLVFLFFILTWIPLHILTLASLPKNKEGYKKAGIPMWPVVESERYTLSVISLSAILTSITAIVAGYLFNVHLFSTIILVAIGIYVILLSIRNLFHPQTTLTMKIFKVASMYMVLAFILLSIGVLLS